MNRKKINELAEFFYSSDDISIVPFRPCLVMGGFNGCDLTKQDFIKLLIFLNGEVNTKSCENFIQTISED